MSLAPGHTLSHYRITAAIGAGGMGEVYRATDTKLGREVALKLLPDAFASDPERLARFEREAKLLASLNHTGIAHLYGFDGVTLADGTKSHVLVMELVEGEDLATRLKRGGLPIDEAVAIAGQIAEALEEAHEKGIVHRDLKPGNVKLTPDGRVKVLDFGLAKAWTGEGPGATSSADLSQSPTLAHTATAAGLILGTAAYMSPEQARGKPVDKRTDIWAFGVLLWEMLTGQRLFEGETVSDVLASVLRAELDWSELPTTAPAGIRRLLRRCLERNPKNRLHDIADARIALDELASGGIEESMIVPAAPTLAADRARRSRFLPWAIAGLCATIAAWLGLGRRDERPPFEAGMTAFGILVPEDHYLWRSESPPLDLSSDGRTLLLVAEGERGASVFRRSFDRMALTRIEGSDGAEQPILSPDRRSIAFFSGGRLRKIPAEGGVPVTLAEARAPRGASWASDGSLVFSPLYNSGLWRVPATGGAAVALTTLDASRQERTHRWPQVLPGGKTVIFTVGLFSSTSDYDGGTIDAVRLDTGQRLTILEGARMARYTAAGYLVFQRREAMLAVRFDPGRLERLGEPFVIQEGIGGNTGSGAGYYAVSAAGTLVYAPESAIPNERALVLADRGGRESELKLAYASFVDPRFSPRGDRLAFAIGTGALRDDDVFVNEISANRVQRLTFNKGSSFPVWSPDGGRVAYTLLKSEGQVLATKSADGSGDEVEIPTGAGFLIPEAWLPDGRFVVSDLERTLDVMLFDPKSGVASPLFASQTAAEYAAALSPDGRLIAYTSTESGPDEVFVESFPPGAGKWQVSAAGGTCPVWSRDGRELYFAAGSTLMAAEVESRDAFRSAAPRPLFSGPYELCRVSRRRYDVGPDGRFVLVKRKLVSRVPRELVVLDGWEMADPARAAGR